MTIVSISGASGAHTIHVVGAAIIRDGRCLIAQRGATMALAHKWEFPGGKIEANETPEEALKREILEELGLLIRVGMLLGSGTARVGQKTIKLDVYASVILSGHLKLREHARVEWVSATELAGYDWADADVPLLEPVAQHVLREGGFIDPTV